MTRHRVFVTDGDQGNSLAIVRALGKRGVGVVVGCTHAIASTFFSRYCSKKTLYRDPLFGEKFIYDVLKAMIKYKSDILFPVTDFSLTQISLHRKRFQERNITLPIAEHSTILKARDKLLTLRIAEKEGIPHPKTFTPTSVKDLDKICDEMKFPIVVKPRIGCGAAGMEYTYSNRQLKSAFRNVEKAFGHHALVQEFIPGSQNVFSVVCIFDEKSRLKAAVTMKKIREDPPSGGACTFGETVWAPQITKVGATLLKKMGWYGIAAVELKLDPRDGLPKLMEVNPRWFGYAALAISAGVDLPYILYKIAVGENVREVTRYHIGLRFAGLPHDFYAFTTKVLPNVKNKKEEILQFIGSYLRGKISFEFLSLSDPLPLLGFTLDMLLRKIGLHRKYDTAKYSIQIARAHSKGNRESVDR